MKPRLQKETKNQTWKIPANSSQWSKPAVEMERLADGFEPISLQEMDSVALLNRMDVKFAMPTGQLLQSMKNLQNDYRMLVVDGKRLNHYRTLYFDTPDFQLYQAHVNGRSERYKVRSREYVDTHLAFLEVKHKTRKDRTIKDRILTPHQVVRIGQDDSSWVESLTLLDGKALEPKLWNTFTRMTLVNKLASERVTLDVGLSFYTDSRSIRLNEIAIAELKMESNDYSSPFWREMRDQRVQPGSFSKYALGVALLYEGIKKNTLKPRIFWVEKMMKGTMYREQF